MTTFRASVFFLLAGCTAFSAPINWSINASLDDGATVTGTFVFNPDTQALTSFNINISAATPGTLTEPGDQNLPTSVFPAFDFTPANSVAAFFPSTDGSFEFLSNANFPNPIAGQPDEMLVFTFVPLSPLTDTSATHITNSSINVNDPFSAECFNCTPYVCFSGATSALCASTSTASAPEPGGLVPLALGNLVLVCALSAVGRRRSHNKIRGEDQSPAYPLR